MMGKKLLIKVYLLLCCCCARAVAQEVQPVGEEIGNQVTPPVMWLLILGILAVLLVCSWLLIRRIDKREEGRDPLANETSDT